MLDVVLEMVLKCGVSPTSLKMQRSLLQQIRKQAQQLAPDRPLPETLESLGLLSTNAHVKQHFSGVEPTVVQSNVRSSYLQYVGLLNQVSSAFIRTAAKCRAGVIL